MPETPRSLKPSYNPNFNELKDSYTFYIHYIQEIFYLTIYNLSSNQIVINCTNNNNLDFDELIKYEKFIKIHKVFRDFNNTDEIFSFIIKSIKENGISIKYVDVNKCICLVFKFPKYNESNINSMNSINCMEIINNFYNVELTLNKKVNNISGYNLINKINKLFNEVYDLKLENKLLKNENEELKNQYSKINNNLILNNYSNNNKNKSNNNSNTFFSSIGSLTEEGFAKIIKEEKEDDEESSKSRNIKDYENFNSIPQNNENNDMNNSDNESEEENERNQKKYIDQFNKEYGTNLIGDETTIDLSPNINNHSSNKPKKPIGDNGLILLCKIKIPRLEKLFLEDNEISDISPLKKAKFLELKVLKLGKNNISNINILEKVKFENLEKLYLNKNKIKDISVFGKAKFHKLEYLNIKNNNIIDINSLNNAEMNNLSILNISNNFIRDTTVFQMRRFPNLKSFINDKSEI